ncbi:hypothetical protein NJT12_06875 [Flavobacterium sp. AC]|uniref:Uncharacterized protein n=1 Tax=Flavobacterium azizsancarii TaxID=2961580 RepID=A0ABT4WB59_9FLAO|nr:DUF6625 family protein [Flavobacterium azizsancarii]MDA6069339.1 hypothetical protein [Flavobacterium azizsancarii]
MTKIALINCYIGPLPWFFNFFLKSCESNPTIDFLLFTDNIIDYKTPHNVKIIPITLSYFNQLSTAKLGFEIEVEKPYKLCDYKPAFGVIFSSYLTKYDFWGITDLDVIYGRIREFMTEEVFEEFDIICVRHDFITACCMLFRNNDYINNLFKKSKDYHLIFTSQKNYAFDETNFEQESIFEKEDIFSIDCEIESMQHIILNEEREGRLKSHFDFLLCEGTAGELLWDNGLFSYKGKLEIMLYHLLNYKGNIFSNNTMKWDQIPDVFHIDKYDFRKNNSFLSRFKAHYTDNLRPKIWNSFKRLDAIISMKVCNRTVNCIEEGEYMYYLSKMKIVITKNGPKGENFLKFANSKHSRLYQLTFNKKYFFAENLPFIFRLEGDKKTHTSFNLISDIGYGNVYNKKAN